MNSQTESYYVFVRRAGDQRWVALGQFDNQREAELIMTGLFARHRRYTRQSVRVLSDTEAKYEFGQDWTFATGLRA